MFNTKRNAIASNLLVEKYSCSTNLVSRLCCEIPSPHGWDYDAGLSIVTPQECVNLPRATLAALCTSGCKPDVGNSTMGITAPVRMCIEQKTSCAAHISNSLSTDQKALCLQRIQSIFFIWSCQAAPRATVSPANLGAKSWLGSLLQLTCSDFHDLTNMLPTNYRGVLAYTRYKPTSLKKIVLHLLLKVQTQKKCICPVCPRIFH